MRRRNKKTAGFTLVEMAVSLGIVGIAGAIAVATFGRLNPPRDFARQARVLSSVLQKARVMAAKGARAPSWPADARAVSAGVVFDTSANTYSVFVDQDNIDANGNEALMYTKELNVELEGYTVEITPSTDVVRFRKNGTLVTSNDVFIDLSEPNHQVTNTVQVTYGGLSKVHL